MHIDIVSIFPEYLDPLSLSLIGKARQRGLVDINVTNLRNYTHDVHQTVDDTPYGGGAGMVMKPEPWGEALDALAVRSSSTSPPVLIVPSPAGLPFTQQMAVELASRDHLIFACGRYEGIDQRVFDEAARTMEVRYVSLGDYVLNGGEVAALAMTEAIVRLVPGVIGNALSLAEESHNNGLLEAPAYTKPATWRGHDVPPVLLSGHHKKISAWRDDISRELTKTRRPDLLTASADAQVHDVTLRHAQLADVGELFTLTRACWLQEAVINDTFNIPVLHEQLDDVRNSLDDWTTLVGHTPENRLVVSARGHMTGASWMVGRVMVAPDLQGRGLGRFILEQIERHAPVAATHAVLYSGSKSTRNHAIYRKAGYRLVDAPDGIDVPEGALFWSKKLRRH